MATEVWFAIPRREIEQTGITFRRRTDSGLHGELTIRQNDIIWRPKGKQKIFKVSWSEFAEFAVESGKRRRPKMTVLKAKQRRKNPAK